jgi:AhpD family alkylhydroperoxidase
MPQRLDYNTASPEGMKALGAVHGYISHSGLPRDLVDLVNLRISLINGCAYCIDMHSADLLKSGLSAGKLALVPVWFEAENLFSDREKAALRWAETVTNVSHTHIPDEEFEAVKQHFNEKELADLTIAIGLMNAYNRMAISFRTTPGAAK